MVLANSPFCFVNRCHVAKLSKPLILNVNNNRAELFKAGLR